MAWNTGALPVFKMDTPSSVTVAIEPPAAENGHVLQLLWRFVVAGPPVAPPPPVVRMVPGNVLNVAPSLMMRLLPPETSRSQYEGIEYVPLVIVPPGVKMVAYSRPDMAAVRLDHVV